MFSSPCNRGWEMYNSNNSSGEKVRGLESNFPVPSGAQSEGGRGCPLRGGHISQYIQAVPCPLAAETDTVSGWTTVSLHMWYCLFDIKLLYRILNVHSMIEMDRYFLNSDYLNVGEVGFIKKGNIKRVLLIV